MVVDALELVLVQAPFAQLHATTAFAKDVPEQ